MVNVSSAFKTALQAGEPQRWLFVWSDGTLSSNEEIDVEAGVGYDEMFCSETDLTIGLTPSSQISFSLLNGEYQWTGFSFGWFNASLGVRVNRVRNDSPRTNHPVLTVSGNSLTVSGNGWLETYELCPFGRFYAERPDIIRRVLIDINAMDQMQLFEQDMPSDTDLGITYPITAGALLTAMCTYLQVTSTVSATFMNYDMTLASRPKSFDTATMRDVLGWIAEIACSVARFNREGNLAFVWLNRVDRSFSETDYVDFERTEYQTTAVNKLSVRNDDSTAETVLGTGDSPYMIQDNPFLNQVASSGGGGT